MVGVDAFRTPGHIGHVNDNSAMAPEPDRPRVCLLAVPGASASVIHGMFDLFAGAGRDWPMVTTGRPGTPLLRPVIVAAQAGDVAAANGLRVTATSSIAEEPAPAAVCVPEVGDDEVVPAGDRHGAEVAWLRRCHDAGAIVATACTGVALLAATGLLDGEDATSHWAHCDLLARRHPRIRVRPYRSLVVAGVGHRLVMAGGGTSWLDLALFLVARLVGIDEAMKLARVSLIEWREAGQQPFARLVGSRQVGDRAIADCQVWIAEHYRNGSPVGEMVRRSGLAERTFTRRFRDATGMSPLEYVHALRIEEAKQMLESGASSIDAIADEVGYQDAGYFARLFRQRVGLTPSQYRRRFGALRRTLLAGSR